jgi:hypothetical protein
MSGNGVLTEDWKITVTRHESEIKELQQCHAAQRERDKGVDRRLASLESSNTWLLRLAASTLIGVLITIVLTAVK